MMDNCIGLRLVGKTWPESLCIVSFRKDKHVGINGVSFFPVKKTQNLDEKDVDIFGG